MSNAVRKEYFKTIREKYFPTATALSTTSREIGKTATLDAGWRWRVSLVFNWLTRSAARKVLILQKCRSYYKMLGI